MLDEVVVFPFQQEVEQYEHHRAGEQAREEELRQRPFVLLAGEDEVALDLLQELFRRKAHEAVAEALDDGFHRAVDEVFLLFREDGARLALFLPARKDALLLLALDERVDAQLRDALLHLDLRAHLLLQERVEEQEDDEADGDGEDEFEECEHQKSLPSGWNVALPSSPSKKSMGSSTPARANLSRNDGFSPVDAKWPMDLPFSSKPVCT